MEKDHYESMCIKLADLHMRGDLDGKIICVFGCTEASGKIIEYLQAIDIRTAYVLDNNEAKLGSLFAGVKVTRPIQVLSLELPLVLIASRAFEPMAAQLKAIGYKGKIVKVVDYNTFAAYSLDDDVFTEKYQRMLRGAAVLEGVRSRFPGKHLIVCPYAAIGDVYWALAYLPYYLRSNNISEFAVVLVNDKCSSVARLFGCKNIECLTQKDMDELVQAALYNRASDILIAHHDRPYTNDMTKLIDAGHLCFAELYKYGVYGLSSTAKQTYPSHNLPYKGNQEIPEGNSVIIAPYAKSVIAVPSEYWTELIDKALAEGRIVFTNGCGGELPLPGTLPLSVRLEEFASAVETAGTFVGIRSGLCELLLGVSCKKCVVFPDVYYSTTKTKVADFFALPRDWKAIVI